MPANVFILENRVLKHKTLPFYESTFLNYDVRRKSNPNKTKMYYDELNLLRPVMQAGNLWDSIKTGFKKIKNVFKKGMDFVDNSEVLKGFKDSALDYIGQKTGVDAHKIYDTAHKVVDALPEWNDVPDPNTDPVAYYNYRQQQYSSNPSSMTGYPTQTYGSNYYGSTNSYPTQSYNNYYGNTTSYPNGYNYNTTPGYTPITRPAQTNNQNGTFTNQLNNTYEQVQKAPLNQQQQSRVRRNMTALSSGLKSCGEDIKTAFLKDRTILNNIPKLFMMASNSATGKLTIDKSFKPILEKFGLKTLTVPKKIHEMIEKMNIHIPEVDLAQVPKTIAAKPANGRLNLGSGENELRVSTIKSNNAISSTNNNSPTKITPDRADAHGRLHLGRGDKAGRELSGSVGKKSKYADIIAKLKN